MTWPVRSTPKSRKYFSILTVTAYFAMRELPIIAGRVSTSAEALALLTLGWFRLSTIAVAMLVVTAIVASPLVFPMTLPYDAMVIVSATAGLFSGVAAYLFVPSIVYTCLAALLVDRTYLLQVGLATALSIFLLKDWRSRFFALLAAAGVLTAVVVIMAFRLPGSEVGYRLRNVGLEIRERFASGHQGQDVSIDGRLDEDQQVVAAYANATSWTWLVGQGAGATLDLSGNPDKAYAIAAILGGHSVHAVLVLPYAVFYRQGLVGLALLCWFVTASLRSLKRAYRESREAGAVTFSFLGTQLILVSLVLGLTEAPTYFQNVLMFAGAGMVDGIRAHTAAEKAGKAATGA